MKELGRFINQAKGKELTFELDEQGVVHWQTIPSGETGYSIPFKTEQRAEAFVDRMANLGGFIKKKQEDAET